MKKGPVTPKGFRDIDPDTAKKRRRIINTIAETLERYGFVPIETPTIEFADTLLGKYGEDEKLIYQFTDRGNRNLALRYDLTVPLARYVANNLGVIEKGPFRRYQIGQVFRGENPQAGRYREFTQFDFDTVGLGSSEEDARVVVAAIKACDAIGLHDSVMLINDRRVFVKLKEQGLANDAELPLVLRALDKLEKIGANGFLVELEQSNIPKDRAQAVLDNIQLLKNALTQSEYMANIVDSARKERINARRVALFPQLARGLDYYTSTIFELRQSERPGELSIGGGGRYDHLIGMFAGKGIPAVGFSFCVDRLVQCCP